MDIRPIKTERDHQAALTDIERLWDAPPGSPDADRLDVLVTLVEAWERGQCPIVPPDDPIEAIRFYMDQKDLSRKDLESTLGNRGQVSRVLNRTRPLSLSMIRTLHDRLGIPAEILIKESLLHD